MSKYIPHDDCNRPNLKAEFSFLFIGVIMGLALAAMVRCERDPMPEVVKRSDCTCCHYVSRHAKMTEFFRKAKHPADPATMATAVLMTSNPKLLAAIAVTENTPPTVRKGGYKSRHRGSWQMSRHNEKHYGKTPHDLLGQAAQADRLLSDLLAESPTVKVAVAKYGGEITGDKYQRRVLLALQEVP